jgi:hypothetical protein
MQFKSKYTALQIYALAQSIVADQELSRNYYFGNDLRALEFNAQRNLPEESERLFMKKFGKNVEQVFNEIAARTRRSQQEQAPAQGQFAVIKHTDLRNGEPLPPAANTLYRVLCTGCGVNLNVTLSELQYCTANGGAFCPKCIRPAAAVKDKIDTTFAEFQKKALQYYPHANNEAAMKAEFVHRKLSDNDISVETWLTIYSALDSKNQLLKKLTVEEMQAMSSAEIAAREKIDPELGGAIAALNASVKTAAPQMFSSSKQRFGQSFAGIGRTSGDGGSR